jgi:hypothetical protein
MIDPNEYADPVSSCLMGRRLQLSGPSAIFKPVATWKLTVNDDIRMRASNPRMALNQSLSAAALLVKRTSKRTSII